MAGNAFALTGKAQAFLRGGLDAYTVYRDRREYPHKLENAIEAYNLGDKVELAGTFCMGQCQQGVCVTVDGDFHSVSPDTAQAFFEEHIKAKV